MLKSSCILILNLLVFVIFRNELALKQMGTIFLVGRAKRAPHWGVQSRFRMIYIIYILEKWFPLWGERAHSLKLFCMYDKRFEI